MSTKNLGQVSGVFIGTTPPDNKVLIWFDNTPNQMVHKIYNPGLTQWVVLDQNVISSITYSELVNIAKNVGLTIGQWFKITDKANALALAITSVKIQYNDSIGNILIDDLGTNIQYHVTSSNLCIDDISGVFDDVNKKLIFTFSEDTPDFVEDDYILAKAKRNNVWKLVKFKISSFLSKATGNSITWNGGFFFNFSNSITGILDKEGGIVSKDTFDNTMVTVSSNINNVGKANQEIIDNANTAITDATKDVVIYNKKTPALETSGEPIDVATGDILLTIVSKFQRWINSFKYATGIKLSNNFSTYATKTPVNNNDTVENAVSKLKKYADLHENSDNIAVSSEAFPPSMTDYPPIGSTDSVKTALAKLVHLVNNISGYQLNDGIIDFSKIDKTGVLPTDLFRIDLTTSFDLVGGGLGGVIIQGKNKNYFTNDEAFPYSPYRIKTYYDSAFPKILSFVPVIPVIPNDTNFYSNAGSLVHYTEGDATLQMIFQIPKTTYTSLYNAGNRYFKCVISSDVYYHLTTEVTNYIPLQYMNYINVNLLQEVLNAGTQQHIVFKISVTPVVTNS